MTARRKVLAAIGLAAAVAIASPSPAEPTAGSATLPPPDPCVDFARSTCEGDAPAGTDAPRRPAFAGSDLARRNLASVRQLLERAAANDGAGADERVLGNFYAACLDTATVEARGRDEATPLLQKAGSVRNRDTFFRYVGEFHAIGIEPVFRLRVEPDPERPAVYSAVLYPPELALGAPAAYLGDDAASRALRDEFAAHVRRLFELLGQPPSMASLGADTVLGVETSLARALSAANAGKRRRVPRAELESMTPGLTWRWYSQGSETESVSEFVFVDPDYFAAMAETVTGLRIEGMQAYLRWHVLEHSSKFMPRAFADERAAFERTLGVAAETDRGDRCAKEAEALLPGQLGPQFSRQVLSKDALERAAALVQSVRESALASVDQARWLGSAAREETRRRLGAMELLVGSSDPASFRAPTLVVRDRYLFDTYVLFHEGYRARVARIGTELNRREWTVSAESDRISYDAPRNALTVPAGILQAPYFDPAGAAAANYARLGAVVGSELIRAIAPERAGQSYERELGCIAELGRPFARPGEPAADTVELAAEVGGIRAAHRAWLRSRSGSGRAAKPGAAEEQAFFTAYAEARCPGNPAAVPPPSRLRVLVPLAAAEEFGRAFACRPGSPARPKRSCGIW